MISNSPHLTPPPPGHIHLWTIPESPDHTLLSPHELDHLSKITNPLARTTFASSRSALRLLVSRYTGTPPSQVATSSLPGGKPILTHHPHLHFNLTHATHHILLAFATTPVGIDIESTLRQAPFHAIAKRFFHPQELLPPPPAPAALPFLHLWTAKEATIKLHGTTLARGLPHTTIHSPTTATHHHHPVHLRHLPLPPHHHACAASHHPIHHLLHRTLQE